MTKEELEIEAEELKLDLMKKFKELNVAEYTTKYGDYYGLMFAGAEIATKELEAQIERLKGDLELWESGACRATNLDKCGVVKELKAQIEEMKRCEICKHYRWNHCSYEINISEDCIQNKLKHFELKE